MNKLIYKFILVGILFFVQLNLAIAGPGGKIAKQVFESPFGKILLVIIVLIFLPLFIYIFAKEFFAIRKTKRVLRMMSMKSPKYFDELLLRNRINDVFTRVHYGWSNADITECSEYMSHWYWQNQQIVYLEKWKENNLENICDLKRINSITPIHIRVSDNLNFENSKIVYKISANMEDYLRKRDSNVIVEGEMGFKDIDTIWTFVLNNETWKVDNIEQIEVLFDYIKMENIIPLHNPINTSA